MQPDLSHADVLEFWRTAGSDRWFESDPAFDAVVRDRFLAAHEAAAAGRLADWEASADGALALVILLDQFPRNMFRGTARAFATDAQAREVARRAVVRGFDRAVEEALRVFFYMPFMHSEELADQDYCVELLRALGDDNAMKYAELHRDAIRRFGRFPHRNEILGRASTPEESAYLDSGGFRG